MSSILERLVLQLRDQISILKNQLDKKDKAINTLPEKLKKSIMKKFPLPQLEHMVHLLFKLHPLLKLPL